MTIKDNFSRYAKHYDQYSSVQNLCAQGLINQIDLNGFSKILDVGCGTGNYTKLLQDKFPKAAIKAVDISYEMLKIAKNKLKAKNTEFILADAQRLKTKDKFDLISSNASFQWFEELDSTLEKYKGLLNNKGSIIFSVFGPDTFLELSKALEQYLGKTQPISASYFLKAKELEKLLRKHFSKVTVTEKSYKKEYKCLKDLLKHIKYTGTRGDNLVKANWTQNTIATLDQIYRDSFGEIIATYQVFFCRGKG